jgi:uncharacterized protein YndB with AHSA1/START domain
MNTQQKTEARVTRRFSASAERVFDAFIDAEKLSIWMGETGESVRADVDARVGGGFTLTVKRDGVEVEHVAEFLELERPRRIVFTWAVLPDFPVGDRVNVDIVATADGCELSLTHELKPEFAEFAERTQGGWSKYLDVLERGFTG